MKRKLNGVRRVASRWVVLASVVLTFSSGAAFAQVPEAPDPGDGEGSAQLLAADVRAEIDSYIQSALIAFDVPGAAIAVLEGGRVAYRGAFGVRGQGNTTPVDTRTLFMIGSITKSMTSTMIGTLVDDGLVAWDAPVQSLLPTFTLAQSEYTPLVTLRHLLSHQSGVARSDVSLFLGPLGPLELIEDVGNTPLLAAPGARFEYQNQAYSLAGFAAARAASARHTDHALSRGYERLMQERVFDRVGMRQTTLDFDRAVRARNHALPNEYSPLAGDVRAVQLGFERFATSVAPAGAVWSNVEDMARYALLHLGDGRNVWGRRVLSQAALEETHTAAVVSDAGSYGLGWGVGDTSLGRILGHSGGTAGFGADVVLLPDQGWGVVVLTNRVSSSAFVQAVERYVLDVLLGRERTPDDDLQALERELRAQRSALMDVTAPVEAADVEGISGSYERNVRFFRRGPDLVLRNEFGDITLRSVPGFPGAFLSVGNTLTGAVAQFGSDGDGKASVTLGLPVIEGEDVRLVHTVTLAKVERERRPRWARDARVEWLRTVHDLRDCGIRLPAARPFRTLVR